MAAKAWKDMPLKRNGADRIEKWRNPGGSFVSPEAEADYKARWAHHRRYQLEQPDRVPVNLAAGFWPRCMQDTRMMP